MIEMKKEEAIKRIGEKRWEEFNEFMRGQTVGINKDGSIDYYEQDVENFLKPEKRRVWD